MLAALSFSLAMLVQPTNGDLYRVLETDPMAFAQADRNGDGDISPREFDDFRFAIAGGIWQRPPGLGGYDVNNDSALTPVELYGEADMTLIPEWFGGFNTGGPAWERRLSPSQQRERAIDRRSGKYYVDDRDGEVYGDYR